MRLIELFEGEKSGKKKTLYCSRKLKNAKELIDWAKEQGFKTCTPADEMHVTIAFSKKEIDWSDLKEDKDPVVVKSKEGRSIEVFKGNAVVLRFESEELQDRWNELIDDYGCSYDFDEYKPHVTITYDGLPEGMELEDIEPYKGELEFGPEHHQPVKLNWKAGIKEKKINEGEELYFVQPDGTWKKNGDGRSKGRTKAEVEKLGGKITEGYSQATLQSWAAGYENNIYVPEDELGGAASEWTWTYVPEFPVKNLTGIMSPKEWAEWMRTEISDKKADGEPGYYNDLKDGSPIREAIVVVQGADGKYGIWDGWHRTGASFLMRPPRTTLPAIVGTNRKSKIEESFRIDDVGNLDSFYDVFKKSYEAETGASWSRDKLFSRAQHWTFYGDPNGFVAVRKQASGMKKLVAVAGDPRSVIKGLDELQKEGGPIWGAVSKPLAMMAKKRGMIVPHMLPGGALFIRKTVPLIPSSVFGGIEPQITKDGGVVFDYPDVGRVEKYLVGNKEYFREAASQPNIAAVLKTLPGISQFLALIGLKGSNA